MPSKRLTQLPDGWTQMSFGEVCQLVKGISYSSDQYADSDGGVPFITIKCVSKSGGFKAEGIKYYKGPIRPHELIQTDDLLIANTDLTRAGDIVGCPVRLPDLASPRITMSMDLSKVKVNPSVADPGFIYYKLMERPARSFMRENSSGSTVLHLKTSAVPRLPVQIPVNIAEQRQIAEVLDTLDTAIHETEAIIAKLKSVKQGLLDDLLTRGIDANGELRLPQAEAQHLYKQSALGWIPMEWEIESVTRACSDVVDCPHSTPSYQDQGVLVARTMHIKDGRFLETLASRVSERQYDERIARLEPQTGDVIFTREAPVGEAFVIPWGMRICLGQRVMLLRPKNGRLVAEYLLAQIYSGAVKDRIATLTSGTTNPHLNVAEVKEFAIPLPPFVEQQEIAKRLSEHEARVHFEMSEQKKLSLLKCGLMDDLLTGRVRVTPLFEGTP
jgi:type I restriction enzyme S subunit